MFRKLIVLVALAILICTGLFVWAAAPEAKPAPPKKPTARDVYKDDLAGNKEVEEVIRNFAGKGAVGDDSAPTPAKEAARQFQVAEGLEMELLASEPVIQQPLYMSFDQRGRMWVVQYLQYPFPAGLKVVKYDQYLRAVFDKVPPPPPNHIRGADKITVLEDTNGDGSFDKVKDVITGLNIVSAVITGRGGIWVLNPPYLLFYPDRNGDDVPDGDPEVRLSGFGLEDTHSVANSLKWGPDGWLYGANGSTTTGIVSSEVTKNVSFKGQMIWRYHPDTKVFEIFAEGGGNTFSLEMDEVGRVFSGTNAGSTRGMHHVQGGYAEKGWAKHGPLTNPYAFGYFFHMKHQGLNERFSQTFMIYDGGTFPSRYDHTIISANSLHNRVTASDLLAETSSYRTVDLPPIVTTPDRWFRPVCVELGPDGSVYIADWYDSRLTHVDPRDNWHKSSGRLYRLKAKDAKPVAPFDLAKQTDAELIELLGHKNRWFRQHAVHALGERRDSATLARLVEIATSTSDKRSLEALWALNLAGGFSEDVAQKTLNHANPHVRRWTVRLLGDDRKVSTLLAGQLAKLAVSEPDVQVRSQLASSAKRLPAESGLAIVRRLAARSEDLDDLHIPLLVWWAIESKCEENSAAVLKLFEDKSVWQLPLVEKSVVERLMQRFATAGSPEDLQVCAKLLALAPSKEHSAKLMAGLLEAFRGRTISGLPPALAEALNKHQKSLGESDLALGLRLGQKEAVNKALKLVADEKADKSTRLSTIEILGQIHQPPAVPILLKLLSSTKFHSIKRTTLEALMQYDDPAIGEQLSKQYHTSLPDEEGVRSTAQRVLASRKPWTLSLLGEVEASRISPRTIPLDIVQQMKLHKDSQIDKLVEKHWGKIRATSPAEKQEEIKRVATLIRTRSGDAAGGKALFTKHCGVCHKLFGEGGQTGPELTGYERDNLGFLLPAVLDPSLAIREEFTNFLIITADGRTLTGLITEQTTRTVTIRGVNNQATLVDRDDIETLQALATSIMPDNLLKDFSDQQIKDLFAYLITRAPTAGVAPPPAAPSGGR